MSHNGYCSGMLKSPPFARLHTLFVQFLGPYSHPICGSILWILHHTHSHSIHITRALITCTFCTSLLLQRAESSAHTQGHLLDWTSGGPLVASSPHAAVMPSPTSAHLCGVEGSGGHLSSAYLCCVLRSDPSRPTSMPLVRHRGPHSV